MRDGQETSLTVPPQETNSFWENSLLFAWNFEFSPKMRTEGYELSMRLQCPIYLNQLCILIFQLFTSRILKFYIFFSLHIFLPFTLQTGLKIPFISNFWYLETSWTFWPDWKSSCFRLVKISRPTSIKKMPRMTTENPIFLWWRKGPPSWRMLMWSSCVGDFLTDWRITSGPWPSLPAGNLEELRRISVSPG